MPSELTGWQIGAVVFTTVVAMEFVAWAVHRYLMHGPLWSWHRSHHEPRTGWTEKNDRFGVLFALFALVLILSGQPLLYWIGIGMSIYGLLYALLHDGLVHRRFPLPGKIRRGYLHRLVQAHHLHHTVKTREGAVSHGFLYAPPVKSLRAKLKG